MAEREGLSRGLPWPLALRAPSLPLRRPNLLSCKFVEPRGSHHDLPHHQNKKGGTKAPFFILAEREGFEPPDRRRSTVFKTAAFDRSATSPGCPGLSCNSITRKPLDPGIISKKSPQNGLYARAFWRTAVDSTKRSESARASQAKGDVHEFPGAYWRATRQKNPGRRPGLSTPRAASGADCSCAHVVTRLRT